MIQRKSVQDQLGNSLGPEMMKRPRPCRLLPHSTTSEKQIVAKVLGGSPNYMKGTSSSEGRRQSQGVQAGLDKKRQSGKKKLDSYYGDKKQSSSCGSNRSLKEGLSFKRSCRISHCWDLNAHKATCSSFLKTSKFTEDVMLASPGVCLYTCCSLKAHLNRNFPPLKSFVCDRRHSLKSHASLKRSGEDGCVNIYVDRKKKNGCTRGIDIQVIDSEVENMDMDWRKAEDLEFESMVSLPEGEGIESCGEQSENPRDDQESEEGGFSNNSINFLLSKQSIIQDDIILGNALDEKLNSKKADESKELDGEKVEERIKLVSRTKETLSTMYQEECTEDWRELNPRESNYLPIIIELGSETVELKHRDMDERKKAEEWMIDYALQHTVNKLAVERKKNVALLVEAFETILPRKPPPALIYGRRVQACN